MLDEAHERTLYTDIAIGLLKKVTLFLLWMVCQMSISVGFLFIVFSHFTDSEEEARPASDCSLGHSGCQGKFDL